MLKEKIKLNFEFNFRYKILNTKHINNLIKGWSKTSFGIKYFFIRIFWYKFGQNLFSIFLQKSPPVFFPLNPYHFLFSCSILAYWEHISCLFLLHFLVDLSFCLDLSFILTCLVLDSREIIKMDEQIIFCDGFEVVPSPEINDLILYECDQSLTNSEVTTDEEEDTIFSGGDSSSGLAAEEDSSGDKPLSFYIVKQPVYDNPEIKAKIDEANQEIFRCNELRINVLSAKKSELAEVSSLYTQMESLVPQSEGYRMVIEEKKKEFDTLLEALRNLRCTTSDQLCFTKEELDHLVIQLFYLTIR